MSFFDKYCGTPSHTISTPITKQNVIDHFTKYIDTYCTTSKDQVCDIKYSFPSEFIGRISTCDFWFYIVNFLENDMLFKQIKQKMCTSGMLFDSDYKIMPFKSYYIVTQQQASQHGEYFVQDYYAIDYNINFVVFRIYKS
jgi:hypothetical protein